MCELCAWSESLCLSCQLSRQVHNKTTTTVHSRSLHTNNMFDLITAKQVIILKNCCMKLIHSKFVIRENT